MITSLNDCHVSANRAEITFVEGTVFGNIAWAEILYGYNDLSPKNKKMGLKRLKKWADEELYQLIQNQ